VRNSKHGRRDPLIRGDKRAVDIGKAYDYKSDDLSYYGAFWPLCKFWLWFRACDDIAHMLPNPSKDAL